jgi:hypothetical protein
MTDKEARILDACTIADFYTIFDDQKKPCAVAANEVLRELSLSEWKRLTASEVMLRLRLVQKYRPADLARLVDVLAMKGEVEGKLKPASREQFNDHVCAVFAAAQMPINKGLSMLDFQSLKKLSK